MATEGKVSRKTKETSINFKVNIEEAMLELEKKNI